MHVVRKLKKTTGLIMAPWFFLAGRSLRLPRLYKMALLSDPYYLRAASEASIGQHSSHHVAQFQLAALMAAEMERPMAERLRRLMPISESQILQDLFCALTLEEKQDGFFIEVGVGGGRSISNTYMLEKYFGWSGILVEPNRSSHETIVECRTSYLDKRAAASRSGRSLRFQEIVGAGEHSRIAGTVGHKLQNATVKEYQVTTVTLDELLGERSAPREIDYLSLDTEGSEIDILKGLDLSRFCFKVMTIEHNFDARTMAELDRILVPKGYRVVLPHISAIDSWYVHESVKTPGFFGLGGNAG